MKIQIHATNDDNFKINTVKFGDKYLASDGERICIEETPKQAKDCVETLQQGIDPTDPIIVTPPRNAAPLENSNGGHPFDPFGGTSWAGKRNGFN
jgi:hypothetical protein